jgi:hypothetical protein
MTDAGNGTLCNGIKSRRHFNEDEAKESQISLNVFVKFVSHGNASADVFD